MGHEVSVERVELFRRVLGLSPDADMQEVKQRYREAMSSFHPDRPGGDEGTAKLLNEARDFFSAHPNEVASGGASPRGTQDGMPRNENARTRPATAPANSPHAPRRPAAPPAGRAPTPPPGAVPDVSPGVASAAWRAAKSQVVTSELNTNRSRLPVVAILGLVWLGLLVLAIFGWIVSALLGA